MATHCESKVHEAVNTLVTTLGLSFCTLVDRESMSSADAGSALGSILRADLVALNKQVEANCDFANPSAPMLMSLPHFVDAKSAAMVAQQVVHAPLFLPPLQDAGGEPLAKGTLQQLMACYANVASIMALAARVKCHIADAEVALNENGVSFDFKQATLLVSLRAMVRQVQDHLASVDMQALDSKGHQLRFGVFWCCSWLGCVEAFWRLSCDSFFSGIRNLVTNIANKVEKHLPHRSAWVTDDDFDCELSKGHIIDNSFRASFPTANEQLDNFLAHADAASHSLQGKPFKDIDGMQTVVAFATGINSSLEHYLLVQGALSAILCHGDTGKGQGMAQKILMVNMSDNTTKQTAEVLAGGPRAALPGRPHELAAVEGQGAEAGIASDDICGYNCGVQATGGLARAASDRRPGASFGCKRFG